MGLYRGLLGGSRGWLFVGGVFWAGRLMRRFFGRTAEIAATEVLKPGQFVTIAAIAAPTRRERRAAKRT
jgi:hypothetical protein